MPGLTLQQGSEKPSRLGDVSLHLPSPSHTSPFPPEPSSQGGGAVLEEGQELPRKSPGGI